MKLHNRTPRVALNQMARPERGAPRPRQCKACLRVTDELDHAGLCIDRAACNELHPPLFPLDFKFPEREK